MTAIDNKRTGVKAQLVPGDWEEDKLAPGDCLKIDKAPDHLYFACPGCGRLGGVKVGHPKTPDCWDIVSGSPDSPATLTLSPSINCIGCCGWHGYLKDGVFESC